MKIKDKKTYIIAILSMIIIVLAIVMGVTLSNKTPSDNSPTKQPISKVDKTLSGKTPEQDKEDALKAAQELLISANTYEGDLTVPERLAKMEEGSEGMTDTAGMNKRIRFAAEFETDKELQMTTYQSLVTLASYLINDEGTITPMSGASNYIYLDSELGIAFVPVNAFALSANSFSLEMAYLDGEWKLAPYSLLSMVQLSSSLTVVN